MKMKTLYALLLLSTLFTISCKEQPKATPAPTFVINGAIQDSITQRVFTTVEMALDDFTCDTLPVSNNLFSYVFETDSVVRVRLYTDSVSTSFYICSHDSIHATLYPDSILIEGLSLPYAQNEISSFLLIDKDSLSTLPQLLQDHIRAYKKDKLQVGKKMPSAYFKDQDNKGINTIEMNDATRLYSFYHTKDSASFAKIIALKDLQKKYKKKNIQFIHVCLDDNDSIWKETLKENKLDEGTLVHVKQGFNNKDIQSLGIQTVPFNVLVDGKAFVIATAVYGDSLSNLLKTHVKNKTQKPKAKSNR